MLVVWVKTYAADNTSRPISHPVLNSTGYILNYHTLHTNYQLYAIKKATAAIFGGQRRDRCRLASIHSAVRLLDKIMRGRQEKNTSSVDCKRSNASRVPFVTQAVASGKEDRTSYPSRRKLVVDLDKLFSKKRMYDVMAIINTLSARAI